MNYNDIVEINESVRQFNGLYKNTLKSYFVKSIYINNIVIEDVDDPRIRKSINPSEIVTINGMTIKRNAKA